MDPSLEASYEEQFDDLHRLAQRAAFVIGGDRELAHDVAQEVLFKAYVRWATVCDYAEPWVTRVATNQALSGLRGSKRRLRREQRVAGTEPAATKDSGLRTDLIAELGLLTRRQRDAVVLQYVYGFSGAETAHSMGVSEGTVKNYSHRARQKLRARLGEDYLLEAAI